MLDYIHVPTDSMHNRHVCIAMYTHCKNRIVNAKIELLKLRVHWLLQLQGLKLLYNVI